MRHSVLNAEAFTAVFFLLIVLLRVRPGSFAGHGIRVSDRTLSSLIAAVTLAAFWPALRMPLLHDSYGHVYTATHTSLAAVLRGFVAHPTRGDFFFRPLGYLSFWIDAHWAGTSASLWHGWSVSVHVLNCLLVYALARRLEIGKLGSLVAALFFALHGTRPEAVAWVAARFDLLAAFFSLLTVLAVLKTTESKPGHWLLPVALCTAAAVLSKESAYCLPLLVLGVMRLKGVPVRLFGPFTVVLTTSVVLFAYRAWVLRGIGGYGAESGSPSILQFNLLRSLNALFFREWALLFFPVNWAAQPGPMLWIGLAAGISALLISLVLAFGIRSKLALTLAVTLAAALPVQHLLLIGADLSGARVLYLPVLGLALFWAVIADNLKLRTAQYAIAALLLSWQAIALEHNLATWGRVARLSQHACEFLATELVREPSSIAVPNAPATLDGVFFLKNSLPACVMLNSAGALKQLPDISVDAGSGRRVYEWDGGERFYRVR